MINTRLDWYFSKEKNMYCADTEFGQYMVRENSFPLLWLDYLQRPSWMSEERCISVEFGKHFCQKHYETLVK